VVFEMPTLLLIIFISRFSFFLSFICVAVLDSPRIAQIHPAFFPMEYDSEPKDTTDCHFVTLDELLGYISATNLQSFLCCCKTNKKLTRSYRLTAAAVIHALY